MQTSELDFGFCVLGWGSGRLCVPCMGSSRSADEALNTTGLGRITIFCSANGCFACIVKGSFALMFCFPGTGTSSLSSSCSTKS